MGEAATVSITPGRHQRRLRNYLLDSHFQLKYSGYLVMIAVALSVSLGLSTLTSTSSRKSAIAFISWIADESSPRA